MSTQTQLLLVGAAGRMGLEIIRAVARVQGSVSVLGGIVQEGDLPPTGIVVDTGWSEHFTEASVVVDFSAPEGAVQALEIAYQQRLPILVGTTGIPKSYDVFFEKTSSVVPVIRTTNTSVGVNVLLQLANLATKLLGSTFDVEIVETHHRMKKDAPSGTALSLARAVSEARDVELELVKEANRCGNVGERKTGSIGMQALRGGDVAGEHTIFFLGDGERVELTHRATSRAVFADGAVRAAQWLSSWKEQGLRPGMYSMLDVLKGVSKNESPR